MEYVLFFLYGLLANYCIGCVALCSLDTDDVWFQWLKTDPTGGFLYFIMVSLWPVLAVMMIKYRRDYGNE